AAKDDAVAVNAIGTLDRIECFKQVCLTRQLVGITVAAIEMQDDRILRCELARIALPLAEEIHFAQSFVTSVKPGVKSPWLGRGSRIGRRNNEAVRLHTAVDFRDIASHNQSCLASPRCLA